MERISRIWPHPTPAFILTVLRTESVSPSRTLETHWFHRAVLSICRQASFAILNAGWRAVVYLVLTCLVYELGNGAGGLSTLHCIQLLLLTLLHLPHLFRVFVRRLCLELLLLLLLVLHCVHLVCLLQLLWTNFWQDLRLAALSTWLSLRWSLRLHLPIQTVWAAHRYRLYDFLATGCRPVLLS